MREDGPDGGGLDRRVDETRPVADFEPPSLTVIGTVQELTQGNKIGGVADSSMIFATTS